MTSAILGLISLREACLAHPLATSGYRGCKKDGSHNWFRIVCTSIAGLRVADGRRSEPAPGHQQATSLPPTIRADPPRR